jgi:hypothetical protein
MSETVVLSFVGDLFPRRTETPAAVARAIAQWCKPDTYRRSPRAIREVVRTAGEWQGAIAPRRLGLLRARARRATEADFLAAARVVYERRLAARAGADRS